jgi:hypothetical protein
MLDVLAYSILILVHTLFSIFLGEGYNMRKQYIDGILLQLNVVIALGTIASLIWAIYHLIS